MNVYDESDLEKVCKCECCETIDSSLLIIIKKDYVSVISHICKECEKFCLDLFKDVTIVEKYNLSKYNVAA